MASPTIINGDWSSVRQAIRYLDYIKFGVAGTPTFGGITIGTLEGVLQANAGVVTGGADHSDLASIGADNHHAQVHTIVSHDTDATGAQLTTLTDTSNADALHKHLHSVSVPLTYHNETPVRASNNNIHGGFLVVETGQPLDSVPTDLIVSTGTTKLMVCVNAGTDLAGSITVTGSTVDRNTGAVTPADTDTLTIDALTVNGSTVDSNGNDVHIFTGAYLTSKWFTGTVTLSTTDLTLTDVDVFEVAFEQMNDQPILTVDTIDCTLFSTNASAEFDCYLYTLKVVGDKCDIANLSSLHLGADGETALVDRRWRLRRGNIAESLVGATDGFWMEIHYANSPVYIEDVTIKIWVTETGDTG